MVSLFFFLLRKSIPFSSKLHECVHTWCLLVQTFKHKWNKLLINNSITHFYIETYLCCTIFGVFLLSYYSPKRVFQIIWCSIISSFKMHGILLIIKFKHKMFQEWFLNIPHHHLEGLLNNELWASSLPTPTLKFGWDLRICIPNTSLRSDSILLL